MFKNIAGQKVRVFAFDSTTSLPVTGDAANITCNLSKDNAIPAVALTDVNPVETEDGYYLFDVTQEETNADTLDFYPESSTANVIVIVPNFDRQTVLSTFIDVDSGLEEIIIIIRSLVQDLDSSVYSDLSLNRLALVAAIIVQQELYFATSYAINIAAGTITPDPEDNAFKLFTAYKSAILLIQSELRKYSGQSVKIVDGPSSVDLSGMVKEFRSLLDSLNEQYDRMRRDYTLSQNGGAQFGYAVITPTTVSYISPNNFS